MISGKPKGNTGRNRAEALKELGALEPLEEPRGSVPPVQSERNPTHRVRPEPEQLEAKSAMA